MPERGTEGEDGLALGMTVRVGVGRGLGAVGLGGRLKVTLGLRVNILFLLMV